jgi:hypothetical protein
MAFPRADVERLLAQCHRRCCICHRFCGVKIETDHIVPIEQGGPDTIDNAIAVCFECHAEIHSYNARHPRGRKFTADELHRHKEQWLQICDSHPEIFVAPAGYSDVGPVQALIDELEFNERVAQRLSSHEQGCLFQEDQFHRAVALGPPFSRQRQRKKQAKQLTNYTTHRSWGQRASRTARKHGEPSLNGDAI